MRPFFAVVVVIGIALSLAASACRTATQVTFEVTTNVACAELRETEIAVGSLAAVADPGRAPATTAPRCTKEGRIGALVVVPSGDDGELVAVRVTTGVGVSPSQCGPGSKCIVAKRALRFIPHESLTVRVEMAAACEGVVCPGDQTCVSGVCRSATIDDPRRCVSGCGDEALGGGGADAGADADASDATVPSDAADAGSDALDATIDARDATDEGTVFPSVRGFALGARATCAIMPDSTVRCWGSNASGKLGNGDPDADTFAYVPQPVPGLDHVVQLVAGESHFCARLEDGGVMCWGYVGEGATGTGHGTDDLVPARVPLSGAVGVLGAGQKHSCSTDPSGRAIDCWGTWKSVYDGTPGPTRLGDVDASVVAFTGGWGVTCARFDDNTVRCWGENRSGVFGQGDAMAQDAQVTTPLAVPGLPKILTVAVGGSHACVVTEAHTVMCWGDNALDDLGPGVGNSGGDVPTPTLVAVDHVVQVGCGDDHTCVRFEDGGVSCWGYNFYNALGSPTGSTSQTPVHVGNLESASDLVVGPAHACARQENGEVRCWGNNEWHQLGGGAQLGDKPVGAVRVAF